MARKINAQRGHTQQKSTVTVQKKSRLRLIDTETLWDPPKLLRNILLHDRHSVQLFLTIRSVLQCVVFSEVRNIFRVREVFLASVYRKGLLASDRKAWEYGARRTFIMKFLKMMNLIFVLIIPMMSRA